VDEIIEMVLTVKEIFLPRYIVLLIRFLAIKSFTTVFRSDLTNNILTLPSFLQNDILKVNNEDSGICFLRKY
jgi:hypothetical protein